MRFAGSAAPLLNTIDFANKTPSFDALSAAADDGRSLERKAATYAAANVASAGLGAYGDIASAQVGADATRANGQASMWGSIGSGLFDAAGSVGGALIKKPPGAQTGTPKTYGPKTPPPATNGTQMYGGQTINTGMVTV